MRIFRHDRIARILKNVRSISNFSLLACNLVSKRFISLGCIKCVYWVLKCIIISFSRFTNYSELYCTISIKLCVSYFVCFFIRGMKISDWLDISSNSFLLFPDWTVIKTSDKRQFSMDRFPLT